MIITQEIKQQISLYNEKYLNYESFFTNIREELTKIKDQIQNCSYPDFIIQVPYINPSQKKIIYNSFKFGIKTDDEICEELLSVPNIQDFSIENKCINFNFLSENITIEYDNSFYDFNKFLVKCVFYIEDPMIKVRLIPVQKLNDTGIIHPHCSSFGELCTGQSKSLLAELLSQLEVISVYEIINSILKSYAPRDCYYRLENYWLYENEKCPLCDEVMNDDFFFCSHCERKICVNCQGENSSICFPCKSKR
jgi:hypothetical protein